MKLKIRVAVAIDREGNWGAIGWSGADDHEAMLVAIQNAKAGERRYWLECEVDGPDLSNEETVTPRVTVDLEIASPMM